MFLDINGDMKMDMIYTGLDSHGNTQTTIALGETYDSLDFTFEPLSNFFLSSEEDKTCLDPNVNDMISNPHSNSFLDLNGDCIPDIFLSKETIDEDNKKHFYGEIYVQKLVKGKNRYCLS